MLEKGWLDTFRLSIKGAEVDDFTINYVVVMQNVIRCYERAEERF